MKILFILKINKYTVIIYLILFEKGLEFSLVSKWMGNFYLCNSFSIREIILQFSRLLIVISVIFSFLKRLNIELEGNHIYLLTASQ